MEGITAGVSVRLSVQDGSAHHEGMEPRGFACSHSLAAEYPQLPTPSLSPAGAMPRADPTLRASSGCHGHGEEGEKQAEEKGSKKYPRSISTQGYNRRRVGAQGNAPFIQQHFGAGDRDRYHEGHSTIGVAKPFHGRRHAPDGHILHAGTGRYTGEGSWQEPGLPAAVGVGSPKLGTPASSGQQGHGGGTGWVND